MNQRQIRALIGIVMAALGLYRAIQEFRAASSEEAK